MHKHDRRTFLKLIAAPLMLQTGCSFEQVDVAIPVVVSSVNGKVADTNDKSVLLSDDVGLHVVLTARSRTDEHLYFSDGLDRAVINGSLVDEIREWRIFESGLVGINWFEVKSEKGVYDNTVPGGARITYKDVPVGSGWSIRPDGLGTHRYRAVVSYAGREYNSARDRDMIVKKNGTIKGVHRVVVRDGDDLVGRATSLIGLPYIYGSSPEQVEKFVGADCADLVVGAMRMSGTDAPYTHSQALTKYGNVFFRGYISPDGKILGEDKNLANPDIRRGDIIIYRNYPHAAIVHRDMDDGTLEVVQAYHGGIVVERPYEPNFVNSLLLLLGVKNPDSLDKVEIMRMK